MFCKNCGKEIEAQVSFCSNCGAVIEEKKADSLKAVKAIKINKKLLAIALAVVICVVAVVCIFTTVGNKKYNSAEEVAESYVVAAHTADPEKYVECIPDFLIKQMAETYKVSSEDTKALIDAMKSNVANSDKSTCVVLESTKDNSSSLLSEYIENINDYGATNEDLSEIDEYCIVNVNALIDGNARQNVVFCVKYDGGWYALDVD